MPIDIESLLKFSKNCRLCGEGVEVKTLEQKKKYVVTSTHFCLKMNGNCVQTLTFYKKEPPKIVKNRYPKVSAQATIRMYEIAEKIRSKQGITVNKFIKLLQLEKGFHRSSHNFRYPLTKKDIECKIWRDHGVLTVDRYRKYVYAMAAYMAEINFS
jgi:hypothetical protein